MNNVGKLRKFLEISNEDAEKILLTVGSKVQEDLKDLAPEDTGAYKSSIKLSNVEHDDIRHSIKVYTNLPSGWKNVPLGCLIEWGTGVRGEQTNDFDHGYPYRQTPWVYYNKRYGRWIFTRGNKARPHFYLGLYNNQRYFKTQILIGIIKEML